MGKGLIVWGTRETPISRLEGFGRARVAAVGRGGGGNLLQVHRIIYNSTNA